MNYWWEMYFLFVPIIGVLTFFMWLDEREYEKTFGKKEKKKK
jgi:hypothetical protein